MRHIPWSGSSKEDNAAFSYSLRGGFCRNQHDHCGCGWDIPSGAGHDRWKRGCGNGSYVITIWDICSRSSVRGGGIQPLTKYLPSKEGDGKNYHRCQYNLRKRNINQEVATLRMVVIGCTWDVVADRQGLVEISMSERGVSHYLRKIAQIVQADRNLGVCSIQHFLTDCQCLFIVSLCTRIVTYGLKQFPHIVEAHGGIGMIKAKYFPANLKGLFQEISGIRIVAHRS
jgi:hypothetical protein